MLILVLIFGAPLIGIWAAVDASRLPDEAFTAAGTSKTLWIVLPAVGAAVCLVGIVTVPLWFAVIRPRVRAAAGMS